MNDLQVLAHAMFNISVEQELVEPVIIEHEEGDFLSYSTQLLNELLENTRSKSFKFNDLDELVPSHILALVQDLDEWERRTLSIASKLLSEEIEAQNKIKAMDKKIKKGSLLILLLSHDNEIKFVILKIEHGDFFDEVEAKFKRGLPVSRQRLQKSCLVSITNEFLIEDILISDSGSSIRSYWSKNFLATEELQSSELNTKNAFNSIDNFLRKEIKKESPADYLYIRNDVISYFRNNDQFAHDELVTKVESHRLENEGIKEKFSQIIEKLKKLPDLPRSKFDRQFDLEPNVIKAKIRSTIMLNDNVELRINGEITNLQRMILAEKDQIGKYIKIYTENGYKAFGGLEE